MSSLPKPHPRAQMPPSAEHQPTAPTLGENVRRWRLRRGFSQEELAQRAGKSTSVVRKLEQEGSGGKPSGVQLETLYRLARALNVQTAQLFAAPAPKPVRHGALDQALMPIRIALTPPFSLEQRDSSPLPSEPDLRLLDRQLDEAVRLYHANRYADTVRQLPEMIVNARDLGDSVSEGGQQAAAQRLNAGVLQLAGFFLTQIHAYDLAYEAFREAIAEALATDELWLAASAVGGECWLFIREGRLLDAQRCAVAAAQAIEPRISTACPETLSAWGWLQLWAWASAVRNNQPDDAVRYLRLAKTAATGMVGQELDSRHYWTTFSPATAARKEVEHHTLTGEWGAALRLAKDIPSGWPARSDDAHRHLLDVALAHTERGHHGAAISIMTQLRTAAPQWLGHQRLAVAIARSLLSSRARPLTHELRELADFLDLA